MGFKNVHIVHKINAPDSLAVNSVVHDIENWCEFNRVPIIEHIEADKGTLFVAIGGDGTVIHAAKLALQYDACVLGFNIGKVGFLADFPPNEVYESLTAAFDDKLVEESRSTIVLEYEGIKYTALNDIVTSCAASDVTLNYSLILGNKFVGSHTANGVIVSTPTGSTAYALSVGGAIIDPAAEVLEIIPIAAQTLTSRPLIIPAQVDLGIKVTITPDRPINIRIDGNVVTTCQRDKTDFATLRIYSDGGRVRLLHHYSWNHFDVLTEKLYYNKS